MLLQKTTESIVAVSRIVIRSRLAELVVLAPAFVLAGLWYGAEGLVIVSVAVLPLVVLGQRRDQLRAGTDDDQRLDYVTGLPPRQVITAALDRAFALGKISGR